MNKTILYTAPLLLTQISCAGKKPDKPNVIILLADDMGYGDPTCYNPNSKIPTPNIDKLASQGVRYTDIHTTSSVSTPSRYSLLTGRYCWRTKLKEKVNELKELLEYY